MEYDKMTQISGEKTTKKNHAANCFKKTVIMSLSWSQANLIKRTIRLKTILWTARVRQKY